MCISAQYMLLTIVVLENPWYIVTAVSFMSTNRPEAVPLLYNYVLEELEHAQTQFNVPAPEASREKLLLIRKVRDAIFKASLIGGVSKV